eukprot:2241007-Rhodomonas_salina.1
MHYAPHAQQLSCLRTRELDNSCCAGHPTYSACIFLIRAFLGKTGTRVHVLEHREIEEESQDRGKEDAALPHLGCLPTPRPYSRFPFLRTRCVKDAHTLDAPDACLPKPCIRIALTSLNTGDVGCKKCASSERRHEAVKEEGEAPTQKPAAEGDKGSAQGTGSVDGAAATFGEQERSVGGRGGGSGGGGAMAAAEEEESRRPHECSLDDFL